VPYRRVSDLFLSHNSGDGGKGFFGEQLITLLKWFVTYWGQSINLGELLPGPRGPVLSAFIIEYRRRTLS